MDALSQSWTNSVCMGWGWIFLFATSQCSLGPTQPSVQWVPGYFLGGKAAWYAADRSPLSSVNVKSAWNFTFTPPYGCIMWYLVNH